MKKLFLFMFWLFAIWSVFSVADAGKYETAKLDGKNKIHVRIDKKSWDTYRLNAIIDSNRRNNSLSCDILLPNNRLLDASACNKSFEYESNKNEKVKIYLKLNGGEKFWTIEEYYDFDEGEWENGHDVDEDNIRKNYDDDDDDRNNSDIIDNFDISVDDRTPNKNKWIDLTLKARNVDNDIVEDYDNSIEFKVEYKRNGSWKTAPSSYYQIDREYEDKEISFRDSWDGKHEFNNFIKFKREEKFKLTFEDKDNSRIDGDIIIDLDDDNDDNDNDNDSDDADNINVDANTTSPDKNEKVDITLTIRDDDNDTVKDYNNTIKYEVEYKSSSYSSWENAPSSYYDIDNDFDDGEIRFKSSWDGKKKFSDFIKFKKDYKFKLTFKDENNRKIDGDITFDVNNNDDDDRNNSDDIDNFEISVDDRTPNKNKWIDLTLKARDDDNDIVEDYDNNIEFKIEYKRNGSWKTAPSSYYQIDREYEDKEISFRDSWDGKHEFNNFIKFKREEKFKLTFEDKDNSRIDGDIIINLNDDNDDNDNDNDSDDADNFKVSVNNNYPNRNKWVDLTLQVRDNDDDVIENYDNSIEYQVQYNHNGDWKIAKDSYYQVDKKYNNEKISFEKKWNGEKEFEDFIKFKKEKEFRVVFQDENDEDIKGYVTINVWKDTDEESSSKGFSKSELERVKNINKIFPTIINKFKNKYSKLRYNYLWDKKTDEFVKKMENIIEGSRYKDCKDYDDFNKALKEWAKYTIRAMK